MASCHQSARRGHARSACVQLCSRTRYKAGPGRENPALLVRSTLAERVCCATNRSAEQAMLMRFLCAANQQPAGANAPTAAAGQEHALFLLLRSHGSRASSGSASGGRSQQGWASCSKVRHMGALGSKHASPFGLHLAGRSMQRCCVLSSSPRNAASPICARSDAALWDTCASLVTSAALLNMVLSYPCMQGPVKGIFGDRACYHQQPGGKSSVSLTKS